MSIESARREVATLGAAYERELDAIAREYSAAYDGYKARIEAAFQKYRSASEAVARREGMDLARAIMPLGINLARPGLDQLRQRRR